MMKTIHVFAVAALSTVGAWCASAASGSILAQELTLKKGWNLFTLKVTPQQDAAEFFAGWPLVQAGEYDADAARETAQFSSNGSTEGALNNAWHLYVPGKPDLTTLTRLSANMTYLVRLTNAYSTVVSGKPVAARNVFQASASNVLNYAQISLRNPTDKVRLVEYLSGLDSGTWTAYEVWGDGDSPKVFPLTAQTEITGSRTLAFSCAHASDWSGPLFVLPREGIDFGSDRSKALLEVRNDSVVERTVRVSFGCIDGDSESQNQLETNCWVRESGLVGTNSSWVGFSFAEPYDVTLAAGASVSLEIALDRSAWSDLLEETQVSGLLHIDELGATHFRTTVPVGATVGGRSALAALWPNGLWQVDASLDTVSFVTADTSVPVLQPAGGTMKVRLLLQHSVDRTMYLLPRTTVNGVGLTSVVLPQDFKAIACTMSDTNDVKSSFGEAVSFKWRVAETSPLNPFYHARHPNHDGLTADFSARVPSGDTPENYLNTVKPELFSIDNEVTLEWNEGQDSVWNPQEILTGTLTWQFGGLRREGSVTARGSFTMRRLSATCPYEVPESQNSDE